MFYTIGRLVEALHDPGLYPGNETVTLRLASQVFLLVRSAIDQIPANPNSKNRGSREEM